MNPSAADLSGRLVLVGQGVGKVWIDQLSLMPTTTWKGHGLRRDLAEMIAALKPPLSVSLEDALSRAWTEPMPRDGKTRLASRPNAAGFRTVGATRRQEPSAPTSSCNGARIWAPSPST